MLFGVRPRRRWLAAAIGVLVIVACGDVDRELVAVPPPGVEAVLAAGDIGDCSTNADELTAKLVRERDGTVLMLGDAAYVDGTQHDFADCYDPTWGTEKARTRPVPGNHEYHAPGAAPYYEYFGAAAGPAGLGYYSFDLGSWHVVALNSNCDEISCDVGSEQERWLRADLAAHQQPCTLAFMHHPRFASGSRHGSSEEVAPLWDALRDHDADVVLAGHEHIYERLAPVGADDRPDREGMRSFVVGTGGRGHDRLGHGMEMTEARDGTTFGILELWLGAGRYDWHFVPIAGSSFTDAGSGRCH
jgi:hypothetical protein